MRSTKKKPVHQCKCRTCESAPRSAEAIVSAYRMPYVPWTVARPTGIVINFGLVSASSGHSRSFQDVTKVKRRREVTQPHGNVVLRLQDTRQPRQRGPLDSARSRPPTEVVDRAVLAAVPVPGRARVLRGPAVRAAHGHATSVHAATTSVGLHATTIVRSASSNLRPEPTLPLHLVRVMEPAPPPDQSDNGHDRRDQESQHGAQQSRAGGAEQ